MPEPFPSLDSCQKRFLWAHKEVDLALPLFVILVLQEENAEKFPQAFWSRKPFFLSFFFQSQRAGLRCTIFKPYFNDLTPGKASVTSCTLNIGSISGAGFCLTGLHPYAKHTFTDVKRLIKPAPVFISHVQNASNCGASQACVKLLHTGHQRRAKIMVCCTFGSQEKQTRSERKQT